MPNPARAGLQFNKWKKKSTSGFLNDNICFFLSSRPQPWPATTTVYYNNDNNIVYLTVIDLTFSRACSIHEPGVDRQWRERWTTSRFLFVHKYFFSVSLRHRVATIKILSRCNPISAHEDRAISVAHRISRLCGCMTRVFEIPRVFSHGPVTGHLVGTAGVRVHCFAGSSK